MSLSYTLRESFSGFRRTRLSSIISILTICISLVLLGLFTIVTLHASRFIEGLRNKIELEAFLQEPISDDSIAELQQAVSGLEGVRTVTLVTKEEAAQLFTKEFGEEITAVLDFNPLPPSFKISLKEGYKTLGRVEALVAKLRSLKGVESVVYRKTLLELIDQRTQSVHNIMLALGVVISLSAIFLVSNTIRLAIYAKRKIVRTMELVGATSLFIRLPFLLEGMLQSIIGAVLAILTLVALQVFVMPKIETLLQFLHLALSGAAIAQLAAILLVSGIAIGLIGSSISLSRYLRV